jgi:hypothetical protein
MAGWTVSSDDHLIRSNLWSNQLKEVFEDELMGLQYVKMITEFTDGTTINIPSIGQAEVNDYVENAAVQYTAMDTGNYTFTFNDYKSSATYVTDKMKQDSMYMSQVQSMFVPKMQRAIMKSMELDLLAVGPAAQTLANTNAINGAAHRFIGTGTNETMAIKDFAKAKYALQKANVPMTNLIAIVDPSVEYALSTLSTIVDMSNNARWEGIVTSGLSTGMKFIRNIYGFDVYVSQNLKRNAASETISITAASGINNLFFSADATATPFVGIVKQAPRVESKRNIDRQRDEFVTTARYGFGLYRPENMVCVVTDTDQV